MRLRRKKNNEPPGVTPHNIPAWCSSLITTAVLAAGIGAGVVVILTHSGTPATGNLLACQHYEAQRAWVFSLTQPSLADAVQFEADLAADAGQSTGQLNADLGAMLADDQAGESSYVASGEVLADCEALGVTFSPAP